MASDDVGQDIHQVVELEHTSSDVGQSSLVERVHLEPAFHRADEPLHPGTDGILQLEPVAELDANGRNQNLTAFAVPLVNP